MWMNVHLANLLSDLELQTATVLFDLELQTATWWLAHNTISKQIRNGYHHGELVEDLARDWGRGYVQPDELKLTVAAR